MPKKTVSFEFPYPEPGDIADVPKDLYDLAIKVESVLNDWYSPAEQNAMFQKRIIISTTGLPGPGNEGDIVFLVTQ